MTPKLVVDLENSFGRRSHRHADQPQLKVTPEALFARAERLLGRWRSISSPARRA